MMYEFWLPRTYPEPLFLALKDAKSAKILNVVGDAGMPSHHAEIKIIHAISRLGVVRSLMRHT
jgi:hypothetical protein